MHGPDFAALIKERLEQPDGLRFDGYNKDAFFEVATRQMTERKGEGTNPRLRMSSIGSCARRLAFDYFGVPHSGRVIDWRARTVFAFGDLTEMLMLVCLREAIEENGKGWALDMTQDAGGQMETYFYHPASGENILGHPDGLLKSPRGTPYILEIKSASSYAFSAWEKNVDKLGYGWTPDESYYYQINSYMGAEEVEGAYILAMCKDSGAITGWWQPFHHKAWQAIHEHVDMLVMEDEDPMKVPRRLANGDVLGPGTRKEYKGKNGRTYKDKKFGVLPWQCVYCPAHDTCWGDELEKEVSKDWRGRPSKVLRLSKDAMCARLAAEETARRAIEGSPEDVGSWPTRNPEVVKIPED